MNKFFSLKRFGTYTNPIRRFCFGAVTFHIMTWPSKPDGSGSQALLRRGVEM